MISGVHTPGLVIIQINNSSEEEREEMTLNKKKGLRELFTDRAKGPVSKDTPRSRPLPSFPRSFSYS